MLDRLTELGLVDDADFARRWTASRHEARGLSRRAVATELARRGIDRDIIAEATSRISDADELDAATELAVSKLRAGRGVDSDRLTRRVLAALARKGYDPSTAWEAIREAREQLGEDGPDDAGMPPFD